MDTRAIAVLEGDQTGQELLEEALRVLAPDVVGLELEFRHFDLSLESRRRTRNEIVYEAARAIVGLGVRSVIVKGGHLTGDAVDVFYDGSTFTELPARRIETTSTHGTTRRAVTPESVPSGGPKS